MWDDDVFTNFIVSFPSIYTYQIIILRTLNLHDIICQLHLHKSCKKYLVNDKELAKSNVI